MEAASCGSSSNGKSPNEKNAAAKRLKTAMFYFDDAERELDTIWLVGDGGTVRNISDEDWGNIKDFFVRFCR